MPDEFNLLPVDYNPFPADIAAGATAISANDPSLAAMTTGANIQQNRFAWPAQTPEGYPYYQAGELTQQPESPWGWRKDYIRSPAERKQTDFLHGC